MIKKKNDVVVFEGDQILFWSPSVVTLREQREESNLPGIEDHMSPLNDQHMGHEDLFSIDRDYGHQQRYKELSKAFSYEAPHQGIIYDYTVDSQAVNKHLFNARVSPHSTPSKSLGELMRSNNTAKETSFSDFDNIVESHKTPHDMHVYHGVHFNVNDIVKDSPTLYKNPTYMSTSIDPGVAKKFGKIHINGDSYEQHILEIHVPKGSSALVPGQHSSLRAEREVILPRDSKVVIHPNPTKFANGVHLWKATLL